MALIPDVRKTLRNHSRWARPPRDPRTRSTWLPTARSLAAMQRASAALASTCPRVDSRDCALATPSRAPSCSDDVTPVGSGEELLWARQRRVVRASGRTCGNSEREFRSHTTYTTTTELCQVMPMVQIQIYSRRFERYRAVNSKEREKRLRRDSGYEMSRRV